MRRVVALLLAVSAVAGAGCGTSGDPADDARGTVNAFLLNCRRGDGVSAQEALLATARRVFVDLPGVADACAHVIQLPHAGVDWARARVTSVTAVSSRATATIVFPHVRRTVALERGPEGWLIEGPH